MSLRQKQQTAAERNNSYQDKDVTRDSEEEREIKRGASGCQVDQNKHRVPCRQRPRFSQTDTKLDPPLSSSKPQNTATTSSVNPRLRLFEENGFFLFLCPFFFPSSLVFDIKLALSSLISSYPSSFICSFHSNPFFLISCFYIPSSHHPSIHPYNPPSHWLCCPLHPISLIHNWTALTAAEAKQSFN